MKQILSLFSKLNSDTIVYSLLFLFPVFLVTVRHWASSIFGVLALSSLIFLFKRKTQKTELLKEEKLLVWGFAIFFGVYILTSLVNGWGQLQTRYALVELRFLLFVPIYMMVRRREYAATCLMIGGALGVLYAGYDAFKDIYINNQHIYRGAYSQLLTGPIIVLFIGLVLPFYFNMVVRLWHKTVLLLLVCLAFFVVFYTGARSAYLAAIIISTIFFIHQYNGIKKYVYLGVVLISVLVIYNTNQMIHDRVGEAYTEYVEYFSYNNPAEYNVSLGSVGTRLEMWRSTSIFFSDNPIFGIGRGNFNKEVKKYIEQGLLHRNLSDHAHPHNVYSEVLISKGLLGLLSLLCITAYPLIILIRDYRLKQKSAFYGIVLISSYLIFSLTDASTFIKGNYLSTYLIFLAVLFSYHFQQKSKISTESES